VFGLCCYISDTDQADIAIWNMVSGFCSNNRNGERHIAWTFCPCREKPGICHTTKIGSPSLVLITQIAAEIMLIAFLNQGCERPFSGFECHLTADVAVYIRWIRHFLGTVMMEQTPRTSETITPWARVSNRQRTVSHTCTTRDCLLDVQTASYRPPVTHVCRLAST
jgi:hypothetical protein